MKSMSLGDNLAATDGRLRYGALHPNGDVNEHPTRDGAEAEVRDYGGQLVTWTVRYVDDLREREGR